MMRSGSTRTDGCSASSSFSYSSMTSGSRMFSRSVSRYFDGLHGISTDDARAIPEVSRDILRRHPPPDSPPPPPARRREHATPTIFPNLAADHELRASSNNRFPARASPPSAEGNLSSASSSSSSSSWWDDDFDEELTRKVQKALDAFDACLFSDDDEADLDAAFRDECHQWKNAFPSIRVTGKKILPVRREQDVASEDEVIVVHEGDELASLRDVTAEHVKLLRDMILDDLTERIWPQVLSSLERREMWDGALPPHQATAKHAAGSRAFHLPPLPLPLGSVLTPPQTPRSEDAALDGILTVKAKVLQARNKADPKQHHLHLERRPSPHNLLLPLGSPEKVRRWLDDENNLIGLPKPLPDPRALEHVTYKGFFLPPIDWTERVRKAEVLTITSANILQPRKKKESSPKRLPVLDVSSKVGSFRSLIPTRKGVLLSASAVMQGNTHKPQ